MRQLKFRVWNGHSMEENVIVGKFGNFYVNPEAKGDGLNPNDTASLTQNTTKYHENNTVMQFTGLLDKKGKEIWEGDIVMNFGKRGEVKLSAFELSKNWVPCYCAAGKVLTADLNAVCVDVEVIGHCYEPSQKTGT